MMKPQSDGIGFFIAGLLFATMMMFIEGCTTAPPPPYTQIAVSQTAINEAQGVGAAEQAAGNLMSAQDKLSQAKAAMDQRNYERAKFLAEEAEVEARLAEQKTHSARTEKAVKEVQVGIQTLQNELQRQPRQ